MTTYTGYRDEADDQAEFDYPEVGVPVHSSKTPIIISPYTFEEPIADVKKYHTMLKDELQWEEVNLGDKLDKLYKDREEWEELLTRMSAGEDVGMTDVIWSIEDVIEEIDSVKEQIGRVESLTEEVAVLMDMKFSGSSNYGGGDF